MKLSRLPWRGIVLCGLSAAFFHGAPRVLAASRPEAFEYDLSAFKTIPADRRIGQRVAVFPAGMERPRALAAGPGNRIYIAGDGALRVLEPDGRVARTVKLDGSPSCIAVAADGTVFLGMDRRLDSLALDADEALPGTTLGEKTLLTSLAVDAEHLFAADAHSRRVWIFTRAGALKGQIDGRRYRAEGFAIPSAHFDIALEGDGRLWIADPGNQRLVLFSLDGQPADPWGAASMRLEDFCGCCNPTDIARLADGSFVTSEKGLPRIKVYRPDRTLRGALAGPSDFEEGVVGLDLAVDGNGRILALDPARKQILVFTLEADDDARP